MNLIFDQSFNLSRRGIHQLLVEKIKIVMDHDYYQFFYISADGRLLNTDKYEHHHRLEDVTTWNENNIVVLTKKTINIHEIH